MRFVALVLTMSVSAGALTVLAVAYGDDILSAVRTADGSPTDSATGGDNISSAAVPRDCSAQAPTSTEPIANNADIGSVLIELSRRLHPCADRVVVAGADPTARWTGARLAMDEEAVYLLVGTGPDQALTDEIRRLDPAEVVVVGVPPETAAALAGDWELIEQPVDPTAVRPQAPPGSGGPVLWALDGSDPDLAALLTPAATEAGAEILDLGRPSGTPTVETPPVEPPFEPPSVETPPAETPLVETPPAETPPVDWFDAAPTVVEQLLEPVVVQFIGSFSETEIWQLEALRSGVELPGGGLTVLPDRRYIAFYGGPGTSLLGVLGEQDPAATLERMQPLLAEYQTDDAVVVVPTFELIATVAASDAGDDGDYSNETPVSALRPHVDYAADHGVYVLLDLQPGRTDFLTQAKRYEELLVQPHVGLALDPEWRLGPDQVHLRQFGSVDAAEVNEVSAWLAGLVREHALPQKMFLIHQFKLSMVTNRSAITGRPELSMVIQMDGQGPLSTKYGTLAALVRGAEDAPWRWGWKNFYDEDTPMATPAQTLAIDPQPVYVSYQ